MFQLTYGDIGTKEFVMALGKLETSVGYKDVNVAYNISRCVSLLRQRIKHSQEEFKKMLKQHSKLDENGEPALSHDDPNYCVIAEGKEEVAKTAFEEFMAKAFTIERHKIKLSDVEHCNLTPGEILAISPMLVDPEEVEQTKVKIVN